MYSDAVKAEAIAWFHTPKGERIPRTMTELARKLGIKHVKTLHRMQSELGGNGGEPEDYNSIAYLQGRIKDADVALLASCVKGSPGAQKVLRQILGQLAEGKEKEPGDIDADELFNIRKQARRELETEGFTPQGN